ncbi:YggS family pyridoxal phosphate-dependent enzyme [Sandaracinobacter sp. RS1-74]|uniref:YggS family pyridoxal phosphate-dependent enzyme n=1 Tax=Sandaracinobacteroides sayramensis TaxID=2913411 RepID=UPI001EDA6239|nr:YggS family pyridoxal phosphate-dependent enzyme [Sandaracinobacteroides sayramensis]MCG2840579.1 YggS family pyridoxal phosphate-dependent enzyme [Sandaracinobacteroides sayramensis]
MKKAIATPAPTLEGSAEERLRALRHALAEAARAGGHAEPKLIAVSKSFKADDIRPLIAAGQRLFGENRVQEAAAKWPELMAETPGLELHLVGQLQSNKAAEAVALFAAIHSLDRSSLVSALARACDARGSQPHLFAQVNIGAEAQKGGVAIEALPALLAEARDAGLGVSGLMAVPPLDKDPAPYFALLAKLAARHGLSGLSMGMSADYDIAATLGATHVRVGSALFGKRMLI